MERLIPLEIFRKTVIPFEVLPFLPFFPKRPKFFVPFVWLTSARLARKAEGGLFQPRPTPYLVFCKWYNSYPFLFSFSSPVPFVRNFSPKFP